MTNHYTETVDRSWHSGAGLVDSVASFAESLASDSWVDPLFSGVVLVVDAAATASDPLGSLIAAGLGWVIDHISPIKDWFNHLAGNPEAVSGFALTWANVSTGLVQNGCTYQQRLRNDLADMTETGAIADYQEFGANTAELVNSQGTAASATATALKRASMIVGFVHGMLRDVLSTLVGAIISWAAEALLSVGTLIPWIVEQVSTRVSALVLKVGKSVKAVVTSCKSLEDLLVGLKGVSDDLLAFLDKIVPNPRLHPAARRASGPARGPGEPQPWRWKPPEGYNPRPGEHTATRRSQAWRNAKEDAVDVVKSTGPTTVINAGEQATHADDEV